MAEVKDHARQHDIRVMFTEIVKNRYIDDVIGCKIRIPSSQASHALDFGVWPQDVTCRIWNQKKPPPKYDSVEYEPPVVPSY
jgi:hypothetical protein